MTITRQTPLTMDGKTRTLAEWAEAIGMNPNLLAQRLRYGWTARRALTEPVDTRRVRGKPLPCGARTIYDCFSCQLADCTAPASRRLEGESWK